MSDTRIWREFTAGLYMFEQGMERVNANLIDIARSNLHLLHNHFLHTSEYRQLLKDTKFSGENSWSTVATGNGVHCRLLTMDSRQIETMPTALAPPLISTNATNADMTAKNYLVLLYVINGKITAQYQHQSTTMFLHGKNNGKTIQLLRTGQACMQSPGNTIHSLSTHNEASQVLIVITPAHRKSHHHSGPAT